MLVESKSYFAGNAVLEYILPAILITLGCISALSVLGVEICDQLNLLKSNMASMSSQAKQQEEFHQQIKMAFQASTMASRNAIGLQSGNTSAIDLPGLSTGMAARVQTLGANGTTSLLAVQLQALAEKLLKDETITQDSANKILALANQGFRLAALERSIEDASQKANSNQEFMNTSILFDGKNITMADAANLIGFTTPTDCNQDIATNPAYMLNPANASPETLSFINLYQAALSDPSITNSAEAQGLISQLSSQISYLSDDVGNIIWSAQLTSQSLTTIHNNVISYASTYDSTAICYMGNGCK